MLSQQAVRHRLVMSFDLILKITRFRLKVIRLSYQVVVLGSFHFSVVIHGSDHNWVGLAGDRYFFGVE